MEDKLILSTRFNSHLASVVIVNGIVVACCNSHADAVMLAKLYEERPSGPDVRVANAIVRFGKAYIPDWEVSN